MDRLHLFAEKSQVLINSGTGSFQKSLVELAQQQIPIEIHGDRQTLHDADYRLLLYSWFVESICDFEKIDENTDKARVWSWIKSGLEAHFGSGKADSKFVSFLTEDIYNKFVLNSKKKRKPWKIALKKELISREIRPKCWICQREFSKEAINNFINSKKLDIKLPSTVDFMFPRGVIARDLSIEVEHIVPFSLKGGDPDDISNLALSCGWCNSSKSNSMSIYTVNRNGKYYCHPNLGRRSIPNRFWIVKLLMIQKNCQNCGATPTIEENKLRPILINDKGIANVNNLKVVCGSCDNIRGERMVESKTYKERVKMKKMNLI